MLQACVSNKISSESKNEVESVVVRTHDGYTFDLPWYEVKDGKLVSTLNTSRIVLEKEQIIEVAINKPKPIKVDLHDAINHNGNISMIAYDTGQRVHNYEFYKLEEVNGVIVGYTYTGGYAANIIIPWDNVKKIDVEKKVQTMDDSAQKIIGWTLYIALECFAIYAGYPAIAWFY